MLTKNLMLTTGSSSSIIFPDYANGEVMTKTEWVADEDCFIIILTATKVPSILYLSTLMIVFWQVMT